MIGALVTRLSVTAGLLIVALIAVACFRQPPVDPAGLDPGAVAVEAAAEPTEPPPPLVDPAPVDANELGEVPVIMYHRILPDPPGGYDRFPRQFRAELRQLYEQGYRPVRAVDLVRGDLDLPAGTSPVVLTFDDSTREQLAYDEAGDIAPDTAIAILLDFAATHEGFDPVASVYVNEAPFGGVADGPRMLADLHARGFELGNHTAGHRNLGQLSAAQVCRGLAGGVELITDAVPGAQVRTLSLPLGVPPQRAGWPPRGRAGGVAYEHEGVFLVGAEPAPSPFSVEFDPLAIPRMRSASWDGGEPDYASGFWLDVLARHPGRRYLSDGDPSRVSFPAALGGRVAKRFRTAANPY